MRRRSIAATALPLAVVLLGLVAGPAAAQPTTPIPTPTDPNSPPMSAPVGPVPPGHAVGDAGTGLGIVRLLPNSSPTSSIVPGYEDKLPKQPAAEVGFGLASARANSEAFLGYEHSIAQAAPGGIALQGITPSAPFALSQTASPDNAEPTSGGLKLPSTPLDALITVRGLAGQVHARWSDTDGPCVDTISDAHTEIASMSLLNAIPTLPSTTDLTGVFDAPKLDATADKTIIDGIKKLTGPMSTLGGVLSGGSAPKADGTGSLLSLPNTLSARSVVRLVDIPGSANKAVQSTSTMQVANVTLLGGTPFELQLKVVSQPTLQVTSTGDAATSTVAYTAPIIEVVQGGKSLGKLDAANPKLDVPIGIPLPGVPGAEELPIIGDLLANGQSVTDAVSQGLQKLDLGVLRIGVAQLNEKSADMTTPFQGYQIGASARMLDVQVLPTEALGLPNLPSALAQVSLGEQIARAYAPTGGVVCRATDQPAPPPSPKPQGKAPQPLAYTSAYQAVPLFWTGTALLLIGVVLVAAVPTLRARRAHAGVVLAAPGTAPPGTTVDTDDSAAAEQPADTDEVDPDAAAANTLDTEPVSEDTDEPDATAEPAAEAPTDDVEATEPEAAAEATGAESTADAAATDEVEATAEVKTADSADEPEPPDADSTT